MIAIKKAAEYLLEEKPTGLKYLKIFVDSQAAIMAVGNPVISSKTVASAVSALNELASGGVSVTIVWIPAHKGHAGNELADKLAKKGAEESDAAYMIPIKTPHSAMRRKIREGIRAEWREQWQQMNTANHSRSFYGGPSVGKAAFVCKLARLELGRFIRIITGHNNLNFFQTKIGLYRSRLCRFCGEFDETITHLMNVCPRFKAERANIFLGKTPGPDMSWSVRQLLAFSYIPGINEAFEGGHEDQDYSITSDVYDTGWLEQEGVDENNNDDLPVS